MNILSHGPQDFTILEADVQPVAISLDDDVPVLSRRSIVKRIGPRRFIQ